MIRYVTYRRDNKTYRKRVIIRIDWGCMWMTGYHYPIKIADIVPGHYYIEREYFEAALQLYKECATNINTKLDKE